MNPIKTGNQIDKPNEIKQERKERRLLYLKEYRDDPIYKLQREVCLTKNPNYYKKWHASHPDYSRKDYRKRINRDPDYFRKYRCKNKERLDIYWRQYRRTERAKKERLTFISVD